MDSSAPLVKALLLNAAYVGAGDVFANVATIDGTPVNADSGFNDPGVRKKAVAIFEEAKIQYAALIQAFQDKTGIFPDPALPAAPASGAPASAAPAPPSGGITLANAAQLVSQILAAIPATHPAATVLQSALPLLGAAAVTVPAPGIATASGS
jgi:hypothetical protein